MRIILTRFETHEMGFPRVSSLKASATIEREPLIQ